jgi:hypothetical protein
MSILLHVGLAKAASTTLQDWFDHHPEIWRFSEKALLKGLAANKKVCVLSDERLSLGLAFDPANGLIRDADSIKEYQKNRCLELKELLPHAHILIVTRGFSEFIHSFYAQYVSKGGILPFPTFFERYADKIADLLDYNHLIGVYQELFGDRVITIPLELLRSDADRFFGTIEERLGLSAEKRPRVRKLNQHLEPRRLQALPLISRAYFKLLQPLRPALQRTLHKHYVRHVARGWLGSYLSHLIPKRLLAPPPPSDLDLSKFNGLAEIFATRETYSTFRTPYLITKNHEKHHYPADRLNISHDSHTQTRSTGK